MTRLRNPYKKHCDCGCGRVHVVKDDSYTRFVKGHKSEIGRYNISESKKAENNPNWKGDNVGRCALHEWVRNHLPMPKLCQICNKAAPHDLANTTGDYNRGLTNWQYLCRRCHMETDNRLNKFTIMARRPKTKI